MNVFSVVDSDTEGARRSQAERREATRNSLVAAAMRCLTQYGYAGATMARIASEAGVTRGALQHHFEDRRALMMSVVEDGYRRLTDDLSKALPTRSSVEERVGELVDSYLHHYGTPHARAAFEVVLAFRDEPTFVGGHRGTLAPLRQQVEARWRATFEDAEVSEDTIYHALEVTRTSVLGFILQSATGVGLTDPGVVRALKASILYLISTDGGRRPAIATDEPKPS